MHFSFSFEIYSLWDDLQANVLFREYILLTHLPVTIVFFWLADENEDWKARALCLLGWVAGLRVQKAILSAVATVSA